MTISEGTQGESHRMKFDLATNFDNHLIEQIAPLHSVNWVYGKMRKDLVGGGRPSIVLPKVSWNDVQSHIDTCHENNLKFNYLLNALCMGNQEFQKRFHSNLLQLLDRLTSMKVDGVTVASPYLCRLIKERYPHFYISVSIYNGVRTLSQINYWEQMGADEITLDLCVNRDFDKLRTFLKGTTGSNMILRLLGNNICLHGCPFVNNHAVAHAHASRQSEFSSSFHIDYQVLSCYNFKIKNPTKLISAKWIRPEDIHLYEDLMQETGNDRLTIKLMERDRSTEWLVRAITAYTNRSYDGNLLDLVNYAGNDVGRKQVHTRSMAIKTITKGYNLRQIRKYKDVVFAPQIDIDNKSLDGFIDGFANGSTACESRLCDDMGWKETREAPRGTESACSYCRRWAERTITLDEPTWTEYVRKSDSFIDDLSQSKIF